MGNEYCVEARNIYKTFGGVHALKDVTLRIKKGEILGLVGENGAGKSTLMKILSGVYTRDNGELLVDGEHVEFYSPHDSQSKGIGIIYQEFALAPHLTVAENIYLGNLGEGKSLVNWRKLNTKAQKLISDLGFDINPLSTVEELSVAYQQVVEIAKALTREVKLLILDEPTAVLAPTEVIKLFEVLNNLRQKGVSIVYISHRLEEVLEICDRITVLKDGTYVDTLITKDTTKDELIIKMIGRSLLDIFPPKSRTFGCEIFRVEHITGKKITDVSFDIKEGEIIGIAGLIGSGRTELVRAMFGADMRYGGNMYFKGERIRVKGIRNAVKQGIGLLPESRKEQGVILDMAVKSNISMTCISKVASALGIIRRTKEDDMAKSQVDALNIKTDSINIEVNSLSGGNQQKVSLAKWLSADCKIIFLDEPTRGVDIGAKVEIYSIIDQLARAGIAVVVISSEMLEVIGLCDKVMVMKRGEVSGFLEGSEICEVNIMKFAV